MGEKPPESIPIWRGFEDGSFDITTEYMEILTYWEDGHGFVFDCAWGVYPGIVFLPDESQWDAVVPRWLRGRRDVVRRRLVQYSEHEVRDDDRDYRRHKKMRWRTR